MDWDALEEVKELNTEIAGLEAELAALRPLAALGERALREEWWVRDAWVLPGREWAIECKACKRTDGHADTCEVLALLAQLENEHA